MIDWIDVAVSGGLVLLFQAAAYYLFERTAVRRTEKRAAVTHEDLAQRLAADSRDQVARLAHAMKNHIEGPLHRK